MKVSLLVWTLSVGSVFAAQPLDQICQSMAQDGIVHAHFTQEKTLAGLPKPLKSTGEFILWKNKGILWQTKTPFVHKILLSPKGIFRLEEDKKLPLMKGQHQDQFILNILTKVLSGAFSEIHEFQVDVLSLKGDKPWKVRLAAKGGMAKFLSSITIEGDQFIHHITVLRANGDRDEISLDHHQLETSLPTEIKNVFND